MRRAIPPFPSTPLWHIERSTRARYTPQHDLVQHLSLLNNGNHSFLGTKLSSLKEGCYELFEALI
jgi:hypothetical protein